MSEQWEVLLATPFLKGGRTLAGLDCAGVAEKINIWMGRARPGEHVFPNLKKHDSTFDAFECFMMSSEENFEELGEETRDAQQVGDFVVTDPTRNGNGAHIYTLVSLQPRVFLTALQGRGIRPIDETRIRNVLAVHRVKGQA